MSDEQDPGFEVRSYDYSVDREPPRPDEKPLDPARGTLADCPACRGTGSVMLLISVRPCGVCKGTGKVAVPSAESTPSTDSAISPQASSPQADSKQADDADDDDDDAVLVPTCAVDLGPGHWVTTNMYDAQNRVRSVTERFVPDQPAKEARNPKLEARNKFKEDKQK